MANVTAEVACDTQVQLDVQVEIVELAVEGAVLMCHQTPTGSWICCTDDATQSCASGFSPVSAAARWEEAQRLAE